MYNFVGAWVARKQKEIFGDIQGDPADHPELIQQLKQAVDNDLKVDYIVTGGCMITNFYPLVFSQNRGAGSRYKNGRLTYFPHQGHRKRQLKAGGSWAQSMSTCEFETNCPLLFSHHP